MDLFLRRVRASAGAGVAAGAAAADVEVGALVAGAVVEVPKRPPEGAAVLVVVVGGLALKRPPVGAEVDAAGAVVVVDVDAGVAPEDDAGVCEPRPRPPPKRPPEGAAPDEVGLLPPSVKVGADVVAPEVVAGWVVDDEVGALLDGGAPPLRPNKLLVCGCSAGLLRLPKRPPDGGCEDG